MIIKAEDLTNKKLSEILLTMQDINDTLTNYERECLIQASKRLLYLDTVKERITNMIEQLERRNDVSSK